MGKDKDEKKKKKDAARREKNNNNDKAQMQLAQTQHRGPLICHCCGVEGHSSKKCKKKDEIPYKDWYVNKAIQTHQATSETATDDNNDPNPTPSDRTPWDLPWHRGHHSTRPGQKRFHPPSNTPIQ